VKSATAMGCETLCRIAYEGPVQQTMRARFRIADVTFGLLGHVVRLLTFGRTNLLCSDAILVFQRRGR
jgi:hypothetical protein